jgi:nucleotide-binding universal stress UspA family protein
MKGYRKVLIAVNGSKDVLKYGLKVAQDEKCWVTVVKVLPEYEGDLSLVGVKNIGDALNGNAKQITSEFEDVAKSERALMKVRIEEGDIPGKIVEVAEEENCDVIIMGGHERRGLKKFFSPGVTEQVINRATCPVLVVRA